MKPKPLIFTTIVYPNHLSEMNALLLVESIRSFAGALSELPIWVFTPGSVQQLSNQTNEHFKKLDVKLISFAFDDSKLPFFFADTIQAVAFAESMAERGTQLLAWLDANTLVLQEPKAFLLPGNKSLGYRPVHHTLIGSRYGEPLDPFWTEIHQSCKVPQDRVFPMRTHIDITEIRPYFNAGILITRPTNRLFRIWHDTFFEVSRKAECQQFYEQDKRYEVFIHQAVLSGVILSLFPKEELHELPHSYNYPLHLMEKDVSDTRPTALEELVTVRHEAFYHDPNWQEEMPAKAALKNWLAKRIKRLQKG